MKGKNKILHLVKFHENETLMSTRHGHQDIKLNLSIQIKSLLLNRSKEIDWMPYFTQRLVDDFASHIRLYRRAEEKIFQVKSEGKRKELYGFFLFSLIVHI